MVCKCIGNVNAIDFNVTRFDKNSMILEMISCEIKKKFNYIYMGNEWQKNPYSNRNKIFEETSHEPLKFSSWSQKLFAQLQVISFENISGNILSLV